MTKLGRSYLHTAACLLAGGTVLQRMTHVSVLEPRFPAHINQVSLGSFLHHFEASAILTSTLSLNLKDFFFLSAVRIEASDYSAAEARMNERPCLRESFLRPDRQTFRKH